MTYTIAEVAKVLGISEGHAYKLAKKGELPTVSLGDRRLVPHLALEVFLNKQAGLVIDTAPGGPTCPTCGCPASDIVHDPSCTCRHCAHTGPRLVERSA
ncbi:MAG TPA: helix-turn-helix domain-containing protein [Acidimicrobiales bacterium]|nr:helix-turn-helix domain-containing protein [Acidimicrobiales bacterium]